MTTYTLRFDDLRPSRRRGFALGDIDRILVADRIEDVRGVLNEAESAVEAGHWVGGWVGYEAAPAFDPALTVLDRTGTSFESLPLIWLAVSRHRRAVPASASGAHRLGDWQALTTQTQHRTAVEAIRRRIEAGDTYQVNHTFLLEADFSGDAAAFYRRLVRSQSCGYGALIDTGAWVVASASPELFFEWKNGSLTCRPMKGTVRRGRDAEEDATLRAWLEASEKNRAENVMIVDMVRNDLGRIAEIGSVEVPALFTSEKYDTVWQLTSTVTARSRPGTGLVDVFDALFPSASITGAPKVSTMAIISELESHPRGVYCGAVGFGGPGPEGPEWAFNVGIRTVLIDRDAGKAFYGTGGGITYDSEPADEYAEARLKAEVLRRTAGELKLLETTRWDPHLGARHLDRHLWRSAASADYFDIPFDPAEVRAAIGRAVKGRSDPARLRILVDREGWVSVEIGELAPDSGAVRLAIDDRPIDPNSPFLYHKTTIRNTYIQASARHPDADDVVLWNESDEVTETTIGNLVLKIEGEWLTPPVASGLLAGTERAARLAAGEIAERVLTLDDLRRADAIARINSVRGWEECELMAPGGAGGRW
jgi:para-aminobenzoate synthetase / 4-amino-4-deoxychorismate lyase